MADTKISALPASTTPLAGTEVLPIVQSGATKQVSVANLTAGRSVSASTLALNTSTISTAKLTIDTTAQVGVDIFRSDVDANYNGIRFRNSTNATTYGSLGFDSAGLRVNGDAGIIYFTGTAGAEYARFNTSGNLAFPSSKGIDFSATSGTGTSELLADYEEGTWTAVLRGATTAGTYEFVNNTCQYTKVGRVVTLTAFLRLAGSITGGGVGYAQITGLPFEKLNNSFACGPVSFSGVVFTGIPTVAPITSGNTSTLYFPQLITAGGSEVDISGFDTGDYLNFTITYITA
jgi:hypothetical protein